MKIFIFLLLNFYFYSANAFTVLIDPGHGGEDTGAKTFLYSVKKGKKRKKIIYEKDVALAISKAIWNKARKYFKVYLTRSIDRTIALEKRAYMAEKLNADVFISVHLNSEKKRLSHGFEIYFLNGGQGRAIEKLEKAGVAFHEEVNPTINNILNDLVIKKGISESKVLAKIMHGKIKRSVAKDYQIFDRGIKSGLFHVLALTKRPSILLEVGFLSHWKEAKKLMDPIFQEKFANAVVQGLKEFLGKQKVENIYLF